MGLVLAVAVLLDAVLIRLVLLPVVLRLLGDRAWWSPSWLDRVLPRVQLSHGAPTQPRTAATVTQSRS
jgi:RND superfamily putative drug exporter